MASEATAPATDGSKVEETKGPVLAGTKTAADTEATSKDYYFDSYSHFGIHEEMLKDEVRTQTYRKSIVNNKHLFRGKIVLDVGCGTGILSMFAAQAGAKHVYGVDCSSIIDKAAEIVKINGFADKITLIKGKVEEVELPVDKVDIIISEWMGYFLLYESMLDTVLVARDKWLAEDGLLFPDKANMYMCAIEDGEYKDEKIAFWDNVYGFNMAPIKALAMLEPLVDTVQADAVISNDASFFEIDISTVTKEELTFTRPFEISFTRKEICHAVVSYFDVEFSASHKKLTIPTGPQDEYTHWKQTVFYLAEPLAVAVGDKLSGVLTCAPNSKNPRDLDIDIAFSFRGASGDMDWTQTFRLR